jgi:hypothetical protein
MIFYLGLSVLESAVAELDMSCFTVIRSALSRRMDAEQKLRKMIATKILYAKH